MTPVMNVMRTATWITVFRLSKRAAVVKSGKWLLVLAVVAAGCDRGNPSSTPTSPGSSAPLNITGTWTGSIADNGGAASDVTLRLTHDSVKQTVTGTVNWTGATTAAGTLTGTVSGMTLLFRIFIPVGGFTSPASSRFCLATLNGVAPGVTSTEFSSEYTGTNTCSGLVPLPGALQVHR
jgi:hypothetical protein